MLRMLSIDSTWSDMRRFGRGKAYVDFPGLLEQGGGGVRESLFRLIQDIRPGPGGEG